MMKRNKIQYCNAIPALAAVLLLAFSPISAFAFSFMGLNYSVISESNRTAKVASQNNSKSLSGSIIIPSVVEYNGEIYTVTEIEGNAFIECSNIVEIVVPSTTTTIGDGSFAFCSSLEILDLGEAVKSIGADLYTGLSNLKTVISRNPTPPTIKDWGTVRTSATLYVPKSAMEAYSIASIWSYFENIEGIENSGSDEPIYSYVGFKDIQKLTVGYLVEKIEDKQFSNCTRLSEITLDNNLTAIGDEAFSGCTALTEVVLPPSVKTIGAEAFAGNSNMTSIIMGHNVTTIGEKAFDRCPAQTVSITAQTPPAASDNTFSNYTGMLYVQGQAAADAYYDADFCWFQFEGHVMIEPAGIEMDRKPISGKPGDTFQLTATLYPEDVTLPQVFWRSTNPEIATVDKNGLVTLHADLGEIMPMSRGAEEAQDMLSCKIIAESLYADGPVAEVTVNVNDSGVEDVVVDNDNDRINYSEPVEVYNLNGMLMGESLNGLTPGIYIVRQGKLVEKVAVK